MKKLLSCHTIGRARWVRDLCLGCPHDQALNMQLTKNDCMEIGEALDFAIRMSARQWKPVKEKK